MPFILSSHGFMIVVCLGLVLWQFYKGYVPNGVVKLPHKISILCYQTTEHKGHFRKKEISLPQEYVPNGVVNMALGFGFLSMLAGRNTMFLLLPLFFLLAGLL